MDENTEIDAPEEDDEELLGYCWPCGAHFYVLAPHICLAIDGEHYIICKKCWDGMSIFERMVLSLILNPVDDGGLGLRDVSSCFTEGLMVALFGPQLPKLETKDVPPEPDTPPPQERFIT